MPAQTFDALLRAVKRGEFAPAYYLHGPEDLLKEEALRAIVDRALDPSLRDFNLDQRSAVQLDPEEVYALCNTPPMLAERRVVVIREVEAWKRKAKARATMLRYLERPAAESIVILWQSAAEDAEDKEIASRAVTVACEGLAPERAARWVLHRAKLRGVTLEAEAAEHLVRAVGTDLGALAAEMEKLAALGDEVAITADRLATLVGVRHGETVFDWRDAIFSDRPDRAAALLAPVLAQAGVSGVRLVSLLGTTLVGLGAARALYDRQRRPQGPKLEQAIFDLLLRNRPYGLLGYKEEARRWAGWLPRWPATRIRAVIRAALEADVALKSTTLSDERGILLDLIMKATIPWREAA